MDDSNEISLIKIAVVLVSVVILLSVGATLYTFISGQVKDLQQKEIENRKKQNQSIGYVIPGSTDDEILKMV